MSHVLTEEKETALALPSPTEPALQERKRRSSRTDEAPPVLLSLSQQQALRYFSRPTELDRADQKALRDPAETLGLLTSQLIQMLEEYEHEAVCNTYRTLKMIDEHKEFRGGIKTLLQALANNPEVKETMSELAENALVNPAIRSFLHDIIIHKVSSS